MTTITTTAPVARKPLYTSLFVQVLAALVLGIVLGMAVSDFAVGLKIFSDAFLKLISMIVAPIVFCVVVLGIAGAGDLKKVGRVGVKALVYFEVMTTVALIVGLLLAYLFGPGHGMNIDPSALDAKALNTYADNAHKLKGGGIGSFLVNIIPTTSFDALSRNDVLQVLFFAIIFGTSLALVGGEKGEKITSLIDAVSTVLFRAMGLIVRVAPLGVLGAVAYTVGPYGVGSLKQLVLLVLGVSLITSKGAHGVPGSAIVILAATLNAVPSIPAIGLVLVLSVDWFIGMARALGNLIGNCVATVVVAAWEGDLDRAKARQVLDGTELVDVTAG